MNEIFKIDDIDTLLVLRTIWLNQTIKIKTLQTIYLMKDSELDKIITKLTGIGIILNEDSSLSINKDYGYVTGIEIRPESYTAVGVDLSGEIFFSKTEDISKNNGSP